MGGEKILRNPLDIGNIYVTILGMKYELREYVEGDTSPFARWFNKLAPVTAARIDKYLSECNRGISAIRGPSVEGSRN